jgi:peptidoglycan-N-acetylglucosamine deacetylase
MRAVAFLSCAFMVLAVTAARAAECPGNPDAIGTSRTIAVDPAEHPRVGTMQYSETLPLANKEVVLTFDDGPVPRYSKVVLATLAAECVKATYFLVGHMAQVYPETVREMLAGGHTLGTHSQNHPLSFEKMPIERAQVEVEQGIANVGAALGDPQAVAPFFRIPGLLRAERVETYLASRSIMVWSSDVVGDDWKRIAPAEIVRRVMERLEVKGKGIILLHDIHPNTAAALPDLLRELKAHGYRIVHVVPASPSVPKTATEPQQWVLHAPGTPRIWPRGRAVNTAGLADLMTPDGADAPTLASARGLRLEAEPAHLTAGLDSRSSAWPTAQPAVASGAIALPAPQFRRSEFRDVIRATAAKSTQAGQEPAAKATEPAAPGPHADARPLMRLSVTAALPPVGFP